MHLINMCTQDKILTHPHISMNSWSEMPERIYTFTERTCLSVGVYANILVHDLTSFASRFFKKQEKVARNIYILSAKITTTFHPRGGVFTGRASPETPMFGV